MKLLTGNLRIEVPFASDVSDAAGSNNPISIRRAGMPSYCTMHLFVLLIAFYSTEIQPLDVID